MKSKEEMTNEQKKSTCFAKALCQPVHIFNFELCFGLCYCFVTRMCLYRFFHYR
jgi:hypothetical protein